MFSVSVENSFDFMSGEYAELFEGSSATAFQHPVWLSSLYAKLMAHNSAQPLIIVVRHQTDARLALVLPLVKRRYSGLQAVEFAALRVSDYVAPIARPEIFRQIVDDRPARTAVRKALNPHDVLRITKLQTNGMPLEDLLGAGQRQEMGTNTYASHLGDSYENWRVQNLGKSLCKELDKKSRKLHRRGPVVFGCATDPEEILQIFELMKGFREERFADEIDGELLRIPAYFDFYLEIARQSQSGFSRLYVLWLDGQPIAAQLGVAHGNAFLGILGGLDYANFKNYSIGMLMMQEIARDCIIRGETTLDFTIGDEPYKRTLGGTAEPMWQFSQSGSPLGFIATTLVDKVPGIWALARKVYS